MFKGVDVNGAHEQGWAPLHVAAVNGKREVSKIMGFFLEREQTQTSFKKFHRK